MGSRMQRLWVATFLCVAAAWALAYAEGVGVYVQSTRAKVYAEPSFEAPVQAVVEQGTRLMVLERKGRWCLVERDAIRGWVPRVLLGVRPPRAKITILDEESAEELVKKARKRASAASAAGATRGLVSSEARERMMETQEADWKELEKMESFRAPEEELEAFEKPLEEGREE